MHYIRFLKPPRLLPGAGLTLAAKITVTTDLGESFLWEDVALIVEAVSGHDKVIGKGGEFLWKGLDGMRSLEVSVLLSKPRSKGEAIKMLVRPKEQKYASENFEALLDQKEGGIVTVRSTPISTSPSTTTVGMAERVFTTGNKSIHIWEETGESIARHIWYSPFTSPHSGTSPPIHSLTPPQGRRPDPLIPPLQPLAAHIPRHYPPKPPSPPLKAESKHPRTRRRLRNRRHHARNILPHRAYHAHRPP